MYRRYQNRDRGQGPHIALIFAMAARYRQGWRDASALCGLIRIPAGALNNGRAPLDVRHNGRLPVAGDGKKDLITINGEFTCSIVIARYTTFRVGGVMRWKLGGEGSRGCSAR